MKFIRPVAVLATVLLFHPLTAAAQYGGHFDAEGVNPDGSAYEAHLIIDDKGDGVHYLTWQFSNGSSDYRGIGLTTEHGLGVGWSEGDGYGVVIYKVDGGKLSGDWLDESAEFEYGYEDLEGPPGLDGTYDIVEAQLPDEGDSYTGTVEIHPNGDVYDLTWYIDGTTNHGVGILKGDELIVGYGNFAGVVYYEPNAEGMTGEWAIQTDNRPGTEKLTLLHGPH